MQASEFENYRCWSNGAEGRMYSEKIRWSLVRFGSKSVHTSEISRPASPCLPCRSGWGWGRGIARWGLKPKVWPSKCLCAECAGLPAGPAGRRAGITAVPSRPGPASLRPEADPATFQRVLDFSLVWAV